MTKKFPNLQGLLISLLIAAIAFALSPIVPVLNSIILGLFIGIILGNTLKFKAELKSQFSFISSKFLEFSIVFLAFSIDYGQLGQTGGQGIVLVVIMIAVLLVLSRILSNWFPKIRNTSWLIGFGTAICGSSAIAALAPTVSKDKSDAAISIAVVNLLGTIGMIALPLVLAPMAIGDEIKGIFIGSSLHSVGNVAGAAYTMGNDIGETALTIKLARVAMLSPALIVFNFLIQKDGKKDWRKMIKLPWCLLGFIIISILNSIVHINPQFSNILNDTGKFLLTVSMVAIGLNMSFSAMIHSGKKGMLFGLILFVLQLVLIALIMWMLF